MQRLVRHGPDAGDRGQGETPECDVLGFRRNGQPDQAALFAHHPDPSRGRAVPNQEELPASPQKDTGSDPSASLSARRGAAAGSSRGNARARPRSGRPGPGSGFVTIRAMSSEPIARAGRSRRSRRRREEHDAAGRPRPEPARSPALAAGLSGVIDCTIAPCRPSSEGARASASGRRLDAHVRVGDPAGRDQLRHRALGGLIGRRSRRPRRCRVAADLRVDPDHARRGRRRAGRPSCRG